MSNREASMNGKLKSPNSKATLQITCRICFENVKEPCVCSNLHVFCSFCLNIWLEKNNQCPTCHVPINEANPPRRLVSGVQNFDSSLSKAAQFSDPSFRKARYLTIFQQYEDEISRLNNHVESLKEEVMKLKENAKNYDPQNSPQHDMIQLLKNKLQFVQINFNEACNENKDLKEKYKRLENENSLLVQDIARLKANLNDKTSQLGSKLIVDNLQSKIQNYEKEIRFLKKSLEKSEKYTSSIQTIRNKENKPNEILLSNSSSAFSFVKPSSLTSSLNSAIKPKTDSNFVNKNDLKSVKFSERIDKFPSGLNSSDYSNSPKYPASTNNQIFSNNAKLKKNINLNSNTNNYEFDGSNQFSQSMVIMGNSQPSSFLSSNSSSSFTNQLQNQNFVYSTLRKCRKDEIGFERPDETTSDKSNNFENLNISTSEFKDCIEILNRAEKNVQNRHKSPSSLTQNPNLTSSCLVQTNSDSSIHSSSSSGNSRSANEASSPSCFTNSPSDSSINLTSLSKKIANETSKNSTFNLKSYSFNSYHQENINDLRFKENSPNLNYSKKNSNYSIANRSRTIEPINRNF